jgi:diguanylate cyclase (GGDEF)-like protein
MKITGVRPDPLAGVRRRVALQSAAGAAARAPDTAEFLGLSETDLSPQVRAALGRLLTEIDELRGEVGRLKSHLTETEKLADHDVLTPLLNRRAFLRELGRTIAFVQRYGSIASLVYLDLDGFKAVNDRFGHAGGDAALKAVAARLAANVRETDVVGRIGGDEFGVILAQADAVAAEAKAEQLAKAIESEPVQSGEWMMPLHLSWGVRQVEADVLPDDLLAQADEAMFASKRRRAQGPHSP